MHRNIIKITYIGCPNYIRKKMIFTTFISYNEPRELLIISSIYRYYRCNAIQCVIEKIWITQSVSTQEEKGSI
jgi:hypothetical protein